MALSLRERLRRLRPAARGDRPHLAGADGHRSTVGPPGVKGDGDVLATVDFGEALPLRHFSTAAGAAVGVETTYAASHRQGRMRLDAVLTVPEKGWRRLLPWGDGPFPIERAVFLDLETTGLGQGTGTYAFLIGVGRFIDGQFRLRQFFMRDVPEEGPLLEALRAELADAAALVTFNGRSFDWPLLETRATLHRLRLPRLPHLDVLHPARRVWRPLLGSSSLTTLEEAVLHVAREDDVPGHLIPQRYFRFLETGDAASLVDVVAHNRLDILSMTALVGYLGWALARPRKAGPDGRRLLDGELYTIGRWLLPDPEGVACLEDAWRGELPRGQRRECGRLLATTYKRMGRIEDAVSLWTTLAEEDGGGGSAWAAIELAKHYEHRVRNLSAARQWTERALDLVQRRRMLGRALRGSLDLSYFGAGLQAHGRRALDRGFTADPFVKERDDILHRLRRLERKLGAG